MVEWELFDGGGGGGRWWRQLAGLSKRESKACCWTEGVPSENTSGFGKTMAEAAAELVSVSAGS